MATIPLTAANARPGRCVRLGPADVRVISNTPAAPGKVVIIGLTVSGAEVARIFPSGYVLDLA